MKQVIQFAKSTLRTRDNFQISFLRSPPLKSESKLCVFSHATGFCKELWIPFIEELRRLGNTDEHILIDQRNHGDSGVLNRKLLENGYDWRQSGTDVVDVVQHLNSDKNRQVVGIGHSGGGTATILAELANPGLFQSLYLVEPILFPKEISVSPKSAHALRRRNYFETKEEAKNYFSKKSLFKVFTPQAFERYVEDGLRQKSTSLGDDSNEGFVLKCTPQQEAFTFEKISMLGLLDEVHLLNLPVHMVCGKDSDTINFDYLMNYSTMISNSTCEVIPNTGHLVPFQDPKALAISLIKWLNVSKTFKSHL